MARTRGRTDKNRLQAPARTAKIVREHGRFVGTAFDGKSLCKIAEARIPSPRREAAR